MNCYVTNPKRIESELPSDLNKENTLFYPESGMTTIDKHHSGRPSEYHVVTDEPMFVGLYKKQEVFIWKDGAWVNPDFQTYGCSLSIIMDNIFGIESSIPRAVIDGKTTNCMGHKINKHGKKD